MEQREEFQIREARDGDLTQLLELYLQLHPGETPASNEVLLRVWRGIIAAPDYHILLAEADGVITSSVTVVVIRNLTRGASPYAVIENVITRQGFRNRGYASALMERAVQIAEDEGCYKVSLTTGNKDEGTFRFYERCGFNRNDKTAFIHWCKDVQSKHNRGSLS